MQVKTLRWKRATSMALFVLMLSFIGATNANAHNDDIQNDDCDRAIYNFSEYCPSGQKLYYKITDNTLNYVSLSPKYSTSAAPYGLNPPTGNIILPETVVHNGITYTVTGIADYTFNNCPGLTGSLVIPNTVTSIGVGAFGFCSGFTGTLTLSESLTFIGDQAFYECSNFHGDLTIPNGVTEIQATSFWHCSNLNGTLTLPNALTYIGSNAFEDCGFTGPLVLPNTLLAISHHAFAHCNGFTGDLIIPNMITVLDEGVFEGCSGFDGDLVIPGSSNDFFPDVFKGCSNLQSIYYYSTSLPTFTPDANLNNIFSGISGNTPLYVPNTSNFSSWTYFTNKQQRNFFVYGVDSNWNNPNNWVSNMGGDVVIVADCDMNSLSADINTLTIISRYNLSINPGSTLSVNSTITNRGNAANLIIEDGGQLMHNQSGVLATVKKSIDAYDTNDGWYLISSPLASSIAVSSVENLLSNNYDLYYYDEPTYYWINQELASNSFTELESGKGYLYANSENVALGFAGALKNGTETVTVTPLSYEGAQLKGFNLIGNPYAHNITSLTTVDVEEGCYRMNDNLDDLMVSEVSADEPLKPTEGIFVKATSTNASVTFNPNNTRTEIEKTGNICIEVMENGKIADRLLVKRNEGNDFQKLSLRDNRTKVFATRDNEELAIVVCNDDEQTVNFKTAKNGTYTISVTLQNVEADYLHLIDNLTGNDVDLLATPTYSFDAKTTDYASRFRLVFSPKAIENGSNESFAFIANDEFIIANEGIATLQVIDLTGRILSTETINGSFNKPINMSKGVYMLRLINGNDVKTQKIVVE